MDNKEFLLSVLKTAFSVVIPWKINWYHNNSQEYVKGWNDCIKEAKKKRKLFMDMVKNLKS